VLKHNLLYICTPFFHQVTENEGFNSIRTMNIEQTSIDALNAELTIRIEPTDYADKYEKALKDYRKKVQLPGFRPGHVPSSLVKQRFGKSLLAEQINTMLQDAIYKYIGEKQLSVLGNPLPKESGEVGNWDNPSDFTFVYELGLAPDFTIDLSKDQSFNYYEVNVDDTLVNRQMKDYARRFGTMSEPEKSEGEDMLMVQLSELNEDGTVKEGGISSKTTVSIEFIKNKELQAKLIGLVKGDTVNVDPHQLSENHEDLAQMLGVTHDAVHHLTSTFQLVVNEIKRVSAAPLNQELFDKLFEAGTITSEEEMRTKVKADLEKMFERDSDWQFKKDFVVQIVERTAVPLPDEFLKRWILLTNEKPVTPEALELEYPMYAQSLKWQLIENKIIKDNDIKVTVEEAIDHVKGILASRFAQYGLPVEDERLVEMAKETLGKREEAKNVYDTLYETKIAELVKERCTIVREKLSYDDFVYKVQH
jgi:trigger factor